MQQDNEHLENEGFLQKSFNYIKSFGKRLLVHACALLCALVVSSAGGGGYVFLGTYMGIICLIAPDSSRHITWLGPVGFGVLQILACFSVGLPLHQCIFWGGVQSFVQRVFVKDFRMGLEWLAAIFLVPIALDSLLNFSNAFYAMASFASLTLVGGIFWRVYKIRNKRTPITKDNKNSSRLNKEQREQKEDVAKAQEKPTDPLEIYTNSIAKLRVKQILLPPNLRKCVQNLVTSGEAIILCMREDNRDMDAGKRFLKRYLEATHLVLDNYQKHQKDAANNPDVAKAIAHSEEVLNRLAQAFANEHNHLLRNNIDDFSAELRVLDTLLKMDQR